MNGCARTCSPPTICSPMTRRSQYLIPAEGERRRGDCGSMLASNYRGADPNRRLRSICMRRIAKQNGPFRISKILKACCTSTAMPASNNWPTTATSCLPPVGAHTGASSTKWPRPPARRWRPKHCAGSENSMSSKHAYVGNRRLIVLLNGALFSRPIVQALHASLEAQLPRVAAAAPWPSHPLCALALARSDPLPRMTPYSTRYQSGRTRDPPRALGRKNHLFAGATVAVTGGRSSVRCRNLQIQRRRTLRLPARRAHRMVDGIPSTASTNCCRGPGNRKSCQDLTDVQAPDAYAVCLCSQPLPIQTAKSFDRMRFSSFAADATIRTANKTDATALQAAIPTEDEHATVLATVQGEAASRRPFGRPGRPLRAAAATALVGTEEWCRLRSNRGMADKMHMARTINLPMSTREVRDR